MGTLEKNQQEALLAEEDNARENKEKPAMAIEDEAVLEKISQIDKALDGANSTKGALGKLAKEKVFRYDSSAQAVINEQKVFKGQKMDENFDEDYYKEASRGLKFIDRLKRINSFGSRGSKQTIRTKREGVLRDKRALREDYDEGDIVLVNRDSEEERREVEAKTGLAPGGSEKLTLLKSYEMVDSQILKTISRDKTSDEAYQTAEKLMLDKIDSLKNKDGAELVSLKESLDKHNIDKANLDKLLASESLSEEYKAEMRENLKESEDKMTSLIAEKEAALQEELSMFAPLRETKAETEGVIENFSSLLADVSEQEKKYQAEINALSGNIRQAEKLHLLDNQQEGLVKKFTEEKSRAEVNLAAFQEKKKAIEDRLNITKDYHKKVSGILTEIEGIGKTKAEIKEKDKSAGKNTPKKAAVSETGEREGNNLLFPQGEESEEEYERAVKEAGERQKEAEEYYGPGPKKIKKLLKNKKGKKEAATSASSQESREPAAQSAEKEESPEKPLNLTNSNWLYELSQEGVKTGEVEILKRYFKNENDVYAVAAVIGEKEASNRYANYLRNEKYKKNKREAGLKARKTIAKIRERYNKTKQE